MKVVVVTYLGANEHLFEEDDDEVPVVHTAYLRTVAFNHAVQVAPTQGLLANTEARRLWISPSAILTISEIEERPPFPAGPREQE